jgi:hypothetical protein
MPIPLNPWSYRYIRKLADEATLLAKIENLSPIMADKALMNWRLNRRFNVPFLGDYVPEGWVMVDEIGFVNTAGTVIGRNIGMTTAEFHDHIKQHTDLGLGVIEMGQTQVLVASYRKEAHDKEN